jgi:DNA repair photolyase
MDGPHPRGRGAGVDPRNRFTGVEITLDGDELDAEHHAGEGDDAAPTRFLRDTSRRVISTNDSPDVPFDVSLNPYRGCEHGCSYCLHGDTLILTSRGDQVPLRTIRPGDAIMGTARSGRYRKLVTTVVSDAWQTMRTAYRVTLGDGTTLLASADHRFLTRRGWKHVVGSTSGRRRRPHLTPNDTLLGTGYVDRPPEPAGTDFALGYLSGVIRGDGTIGQYEYGRRDRLDRQSHFRLAMKDPEALDRARLHLTENGITTWRRTFSAASKERARMEAIGTHAALQVERLRDLIAFPSRPGGSWLRGFLGGIFDAEGSLRDGVIRLSNAEPTILKWVRLALDHFELPYAVDRGHRGVRRPVQSIRITGGIKSVVSFLQLADPAITRKRRIDGHALKSTVPLQVAMVENCRIDCEMFDITTGTGDFIANGVVSHNCYARPTHEYLGLSAGLDFERVILVKEDAPERLAAELAAPSWVPKTLALSGVTDPYQPIERRLEITRRCLQVLAAHRNPVGVITKNALVLRDLDVLAELAAVGAARVTVSITTLDEDLRRVLEPRTSTASRRLAAVRALADAGVSVGVNVAPIIPGLNDHEVPAILGAAAEAGAQGASYTMLRLPGAVAEVFAQWLRHHRPERAERVLARVRDAHGGSLSGARFGERMRGQGPYAEGIRQLFRTHRRRVGLEREWTPLDTSGFRVPGRVRQGGLFDASVDGDPPRGR